MEEYAKIFYSMNQKDAEAKEDLGKDGRSMRSQTRTSFIAIYRD
jgi:hypothetical protein